MARSVSFLKRNVLVFCGLLLCLSGVSSAADPTLSDVVAGVKAVRSQVKSFRVKIVGEAHTSPFTKEGVPASTRSDKVTAEYTWAAPNRFAYEFQTGASNSDGTPLLQQIFKGAFNGHVQKEMSGETVPVHGWIRLAPQSPALGFSPQDIFFTFLGGQLADMLSADRVEFEPSVGNKGLVDCVMLTPPKKDKNGTQHRYRLTASPSRGYAVVRREALLYVPSRMEWVPYFQQVLNEYSLSDAGVWTPGKVTETSYIIDLKHDNPPKVQLKNVIRLSEYTINKKFPDSTFEIEFPPDLAVTDNSIMEPPPEMDAANKRHGEAVFAGPESNGKVQPRQTTGEWWLTIVSVIAALVILNVLIFFFRRRRNNHS